MKEIIKRVKEIIKSEDTLDEEVFFQKRGFEGVKVSKKNFRELEQKKNDDVFCFVDGGNSELIGSNNLSLQLIRVAGTGYKGTKKVFLVREDYHCLITFKEGRFLAETTPTKVRLELEAQDESLREGKSVAKISRIGGFVRRILELELAARLSNKADFIVLDGSLEEKFTYEREFLKKLYSKAGCIAGFCKTNNIVTRKGKSLSGVLSGMKKGTWHYHPVANISTEEFKGDIYMAKLHEKSSHVFRVDVHGGTAEEFFEKLMPNCTDPIFPGYPYGLVMADKAARISNQEKEYQKTKLMVLLGKDWDKIKQLQASQDAHEILDNIG